MSMDKHTYIGPLVECRNFKGKLSVHECFEGGEPLIRANCESVKEPHVYTPNIKYQGGETVTELNEIIKYQGFKTFDTFGVTELLHSFSTAFEKEIEVLRLNFESVEVKFGVMVDWG